MIMIFVFLVSGNECKKAWALLRDAFRRSHKKKKDTKSGQASVREKKWRYEEEMSFLLPYMKERPTKCPIPPVPGFNDYAHEEEVAQSPEVEQQSTDTFTPEVSQQTVGTLPTTPSPAQTPKHPQPKGKRGQKATDETPSTVLMKYIIESKNNTPPPDDIEQVMAGVVTTLRSFPPRERAIAKAKIFKIVSDMEIEILSRPSTSSTVSTPSTFDTYEDNTPMPETIQDFYQGFQPDLTDERVYRHLE
uniref:MADF domain-containing protein n=1 Tax=Heliothis virescens TaxID=7102 RepID=A0A2A4JXY4_HELVI